NFGSPDAEATSDSMPTQLNGQSTFAFPTSTTKVVNATNLIAYVQYDYFTGAAVNSQDINGVISKMVYKNPVDQRTRKGLWVGKGLEEQTTIVYDDANHRIQKTSDLQALNDNLLKTEAFYDGIGRSVEARRYEANGGYVSVQTVPFLTSQDPVTSQWRAASK